MPPEDSDAPYQKVLWPKAGQVQGIPYGPAVVHTDAEYQHQHQCAAAQRHPLRGMRSSTISRNMMTKITNAAISATIGNSPLFRILSFKRRLL